MIGRGEVLKGFYDEGDNKYLDKEIRRKKIKWFNKYLNFYFRLKNKMFVKLLDVLNIVSRIRIFRVIKIKKIIIRCILFWFLEL